MNNQFKMTVSVSMLYFPNWLPPVLNVQPKPISNMIDVGAQVQQVINVECRGVFFEPVLLEIKFQSVYVPHLSLSLSLSLSLFLPIASLSLLSLSVFFVLFTSWYNILVFFLSYFVYCSSSFLFTFQGCTMLIAHTIIPS